MSDISETAARYREGDECAETTGTIHDDIETLQRQIGSLEESLDRLAGRLSPILRDADPRAELVSSMRQRGSSLSGHVVKASGLVAMLVSRVDDLVERADL